MMRLDEPMDIPLTEEHVVWLYRCLLGRNPESEEAVKNHTVGIKTFEQCRQSLRQSDEFRRLISPLQYYVPERVSAPFKKGPNKLCLVSIVKNEKFYIENMIRSAAAIVDFVVIIDTGSMDRTRSIAENLLQTLHLPHVVDRVFFKNFSQARNAALTLVPPEMDWILMLDADEELRPQDYGRFSTLMEAEGVEGWNLPRFNFLDTAKRKPVLNYPDYQLRLFRNRPADPVRYAGRVHERPVNVRAVDAPAARCEHGEAGGPHIHHLGMMDMTQERQRRKAEFYQALAAEAD